MSTYFKCRVKVKKTGKEMTIGAEYPGEERTADELREHFEQHLAHGMELINIEPVDAKPAQTGTMPPEAVEHGIKAEMIARAKAAGQAGTDANAGDAAGGEALPGFDAKTTQPPATGTAAANAKK